MVSSMCIALQNGGHRGSGILRRGASHLVGMAGHALVNKLASLIFILNLFSYFPLLALF